MRLLRFLSSVAALLLLGASTLSAAPAQGRFDGTWQMLFVCDNAPDGARGYSHTFLVSVTNGRLYGGWGVRGNSNSVMFDGMIASDGSVTLTATGLTGNILYNAGHVQEGTPVLFHMIGRFVADRGEGHRIETRPCTMDISRR